MTQSSTHEHDHELLLSLDSHVSLIKLSITSIDGRISQIISNTLDIINHQSFLTNE